MSNHSLNEDTSYACMRTEHDPQF